MINGDSEMGKANVASSGVNQLLLKRSQEEKSLNIFPHPIAAHNLPQKVRGVSLHAIREAGALWLYSGSRDLENCTVVR